MNRDFVEMLAAFSAHAVEYLANRQERETRLAILILRDPKLLETALYYLKSLNTAEGPRKRKTAVRAGRIVRRSEF